MQIIIISNVEGMKHRHTEKDRIKENKIGNNVRREIKSRNGNEKERNRKKRAKRGNKETK
jgi:hypothetical protein